MTIRRTRLTTERYDLGALRLYREDLRAIAAAASEMGDLEIACDGAYEASDAADFDGLPENLSDVTITARRSSSPCAITISFSLSDAHIELVEPDTQAAGVASRVRQICEQRSRPFRSFAHSEGRFIATAGVLLFIAYGVVIYNEPFKPPWTSVWLNWILPGLLLWVIVVGLGFRRLGRRTVHITNASRADRPGYWQRTSDLWMIGIITALVGALVGFALGKFS